MLPLDCFIVTFDLCMKVESLKSGIVYYLKQMYGKVPKLLGFKTVSKVF